MIGPARASTPRPRSWRIMRVRRQPPTQPGASVSEVEADDMLDARRMTKPGILEAEE